MKKFMYYVNEVSVCISLILMIIVLIGYVFGITVICGSLLVSIRTCVLTVIKLILYHATKVYKVNVNTKMITIINEGLI